MQHMLIDDAPPMKMVEAQRGHDWGDPPERPDVHRAWKTDKEQRVRSLALTAARQFSDGSEHDADDAVIKMHCAKANLASALPVPEQIKQI